MAVTIQNLGPIRFHVPGDNLTLEVTVRNIPTGQSIATAWFTVRDKPTDADPPLVQVTGSVGTTEDDADNPGYRKCPVTFQVSQTETRAIGTTLRNYDIQVKTDVDGIYTGLPDTIMAEREEVTRVTS